MTLIFERNAAAGDQYTGLDRFGRVVDQRWIVTANGTHTDRFQYGYDRDSNRLYRSNLVNHAFDELYHANGASSGYDQLNQLTSFTRGTHSDTNGDGIPDTVASPSHSQSWTFDALGNWLSVTTDGTTQTRTANQQNQITAISGLTTPAYDHNGNTVTDQSNKNLVYDAWNRLVAYKNGATVLESFAYDALTRRILENPGTATDLYYSTAWQVLEERQSGTAKKQYVWSPVYVDALIERDRDADGNTGNGLEERLYVQQDANFNVTGLINTTGTVVERYIYDPYGTVTFLTAAWGTRSTSAYASIHLHQGGRYDPATGLYGFRRRERSPTLGTWMQVDPIRFSGGDSNLYRESYDDPVRWLDPSGTQILTSLPPGTTLGTNGVMSIGPPAWLPKQPSKPLNNDDVFRQVARANCCPNEITELILKIAEETSVPRPGWFTIEHNYCERWVDRFLVNLSSAPNARGYKNGIKDATTDSCANSATFVSIKGWRVNSSIGLSGNGDGFRPSSWTAWAGRKSILPRPWG